MSSNSNDDPTEQPIQHAAPSGKSLSKLKRVTVSPRQRYRAHQQQQHEQQRSSGEKVAKDPVTVSPSAVSSTAASSITDSSDNLSTIQKAYRQHKQTRRKQQRCSSSLTTSLHDIMEDFQFCGLYFCELLNDTTEQDKKSTDEDMISKEERKKAMDTTFLGKMIQCGGIHHDSGCIGDDCILSCHDAERDDCSAGEFL